MVLWQLVENGADLSKPHEPDFFFDVESLETANAIASELDELGYSVEVYEPDTENPQFSVKASRKIVLKLEELNKITSQFEALASRHGASYDGWGAEIVE